MNLEKQDSLRCKPFANFGIRFFATIAIALSGTIAHAEDTPQENVVGEVEEFYNSLPAELQSYPREVIEAYVRELQIQSTDIAKPVCTIAYRTNSFLFWNTGAGYVIQVDKNDTSTNLVPSENFSNLFKTLREKLVNGDCRSPNEDEAPSCHVGVDNKSKKSYLAVSYGDRASEVFSPLFDSSDKDSYKQGQSMFHMMDLINFCGKDGHYQSRSLQRRLANDPKLREKFKGLVKRLRPVQ